MSQHEISPVTSQEVTSSYEVFAADDRVEVYWGERYGWLPGTVEAMQGSCDPGEEFRRIQVRMDNGWACWGTGYHPHYVRRAA